MKNKVQVNEIPDLLEEDNSLETHLENSNNEVMPKSRMKRRIENQSKRTLIITVLGIFLIIGGLILWGPSAIIQFSLLLSKGNIDNESQSSGEKMLYIAPPTLDPLPKATNSANLMVKGQITTNKKGKVRIYVNDELADITDIDKNTFSFKDVSLKEGENTIKAQSIFNKEKSNFSEVERIIYLKEPPELNIDDPKDGDRYSGGNSRTIVVKGKTNEGATVTVNDFIAVMKTDGSFSYTYALKDGENILKIVATDEAGNKTEREIKVIYSP